MTLEPIARMESFHEGKSPLMQGLRELHAEKAEAIAALPIVQYPRRSRFRHWWDTKTGELRHRLRAWLGVEAADERNGELDGWLQQLERRINGLEELLGFTAGDLAEVSTNLDADQQEYANNRREDDLRRQLTERNVHSLAARVNQIMAVVNAWRQVGLLRKPAEVALKRLNQTLEDQVRRSMIGEAGKSGSNGQPDLMSAAKKHLVSGPDHPEGEGWEAVACATCGVHVGWFYTLQTELRKPAGAYCKEHGHAKAKDNPGQIFVVERDTTEQPDSPESD